MRASNKATQNHRRVSCKPAHARRAVVESLESRMLLSASYALTKLGDFGPGSTGYLPYGGLIMDSGGNLFGANRNGGANNLGTVFEVAAGTNVITTLASFSSNTGANPMGTLASDSSGDLYGTTYAGGTNGVGTVFEIVAGSGAITTLASFNNPTTGSGSLGGVILDSAGNLYGTTYTGGPGHYGAVFEVAAGSGTITTLGSFNYTNGASPTGTLVSDSSGDIFGTAGGGGVNGRGTVFEVVAGSGTISKLADFSQTVGNTPLGVVMDSSGNLYGNTQSGGLNGSGTVFEVAAGSNTITLLASFSSASGGYPYGGVVLDSQGNLFGITTSFGDSSEGTVYELPAGSNAITVLTSLSSSTGEVSRGGLVMDASGRLYADTFSGGANEFGTVFALIPPAVWTGAGNDNLWSDAANWQSLAVPLSGANVDFPDNGGILQTISMDQSATVNSITLDGTYDLSGVSPIHLSTALTQDNDESSAVDIPLVLDQSAQISVPSPSDSMVLFQGISESTPGQGLNVTGAGFVEFRSGDESYTGTTQISGGDLSLKTVSSSPIQIESGGTLLGLGGDAPSVNASGGTLFLLDQGGTDGLTVDDGLTLSGSSTLQFRLSKNHGINLDPTTVTVTAGQINLNSATLSLVDSGYAPTDSDSLTLIANNTGSPVIGTFASLPEDSVINEGGQHFVLSYQGGASGQDVTLTAVPAAAAVWTGAAGDGSWSSAGNWQGGLVPVATQSVDFPSHSGPATFVNIAANETVGNVSFEGGYVLRSLNNTLTIDGNVAANGTNDQFAVDVALGHNTVVTVGPSLDAAFQSVSDGGNGYGLTKAGAGNLTIEGLSETYTGTTEVAAGDLNVYAQLASPVHVDSGATFGGQASAPAITSVGGTIVLGNIGGATGFSSVSSGFTLDGNSTLSEELSENSNTVTAGVINASGGAINLGGATLQVSINGGGTLNSPTPGIGDAYTLVNNQTGSPVTGTFAGLPEGALFAAGGTTFQISYEGGVLHNDVTLTATGATKLAVVQQPSSTAAAGQSIGTVIVDLQDANGNLITTDTSSVTLSSSTTLVGSTTEQAVGGIATFTGLSITRAGSYTLSAADGALAATTSGVFDITPAASAKLIFAQQPSATSTAGQSIGTVAIEVEDAYGNLVGGDQSNVTISAHSTGVTSAAATSPASMLTGTTTLAAHNGVAVFSNLSITADGTYTLGATDAALTPGASAALTVSGPPAPANVVIAGKRISPLVIDTSIAFPHSAGLLKRLTVRIQSASAGGKTVRSETIRVRNSRAALSNLRIHTAGVYNVVVSDASGRSLTEQITIVAAAPAKLTFLTQPNFVNGRSAAAVGVIDRYGNLSAAADGSIVTLHLGPHPMLGSQPTIGGTVAAAIVNGVASFPDVSLDQNGLARLIATSGKLRQARSNVFVNA